MLPACLSACLSDCLSACLSVSNNVNWHGYGIHKLNFVDLFVASKMNNYVHHSKPLKMVTVFDIIYIYIYIYMF